MKNLIFGLVAPFLLAAASSAQQQAPEIKPETGAAAAAKTPAAPVVVPLAVGTPFNASLITPLDARRNKAGDVFQAEILETVHYQGSVILPKGSVLLGHLVRCSPGGRGRHGSGLFLQFDKAVLKDGEEAILNAGIQALTPAPNHPPSTSGSSLSDEELGLEASDRDQADENLAAPLEGNPERRMIGAVATIPQTSFAPPPLQLSPTHGAFTKQGLFTPDSEGALGMPDVKLYTPLSPGSNGSVLLSTQKNLRLDAGTKLLVVIQPATAVTPDSNP